MSPAIAFELALDHGLCLGVWLPRAVEDADALAQGVLLAEELAMAATMTPVRRRTWIGGRVALRMVLQRAGLDAPPVLVDDRGAPVLPPGIGGSISHKEELAVALVAREAGGARIGVDVEGERPRPIDISAKVLTQGELQEIAHLAHAEREHEVLLRFSAKEAIYKALDPFVRRYVGFHEVSVTPRPDGIAAVHPMLAEKTGAIEARWRLVEGTVLTTARVEPL
jgi:4'-phosphopantetheinyl transferase EntD